MRNKLTHIQLKKLRDGKYHDGGGLMLVVTGGSGKWIYRYTLLGKRREMGLGAYASTTLSDAKKIRDTWEKSVAQGEDPISARAKQKSEAKAAHRRKGVSEN